MTLYQIEHHLYVSSHALTYHHPPCGVCHHQIEHHLFPGLSHAVLPLLTPIIKDTCRSGTTLPPTTTTARLFMDSQSLHSPSTLIAPTPCQPPSHAMLPPRRTC